MATRTSRRERAEESWRRQSDADQQWAKPTTKIKTAALAALFMGARILMQAHRIIRRGAAK